MGLAHPTMEKRESLLAGAANLHGPAQAKRGVVTIEVDGENIVRNHAYGDRQEQRAYGVNDPDAGAQGHGENMLVRRIKSRDREGELEIIASDNDTVVGGIFC